MKNKSKNHHNIVSIRDILNDWLYFTQDFLYIYVINNIVYKFFISILRFRLIVSHCCLIQ